MDMEHIKFLKEVCGKLVFTTMTLLTFRSLFVTWQFIWETDRVITFLFKATENIKFLQQIAMVGLQ